jgi:hypothetical protein
LTKVTYNDKKISAAELIASSQEEENAPKKSEKPKDKAAKAKPKKKAS